MTYKERKEKEKHLLYLIKQNRLRCLDKTAEDFNCCKKTIRRMISDLREDGYDIVYSRISNSYQINY
jgi:biotin operon repressor